jgi:hypothetical protein
MGVEEERVGAPSERVERQAVMPLALEMVVAASGSAPS